MKSEERIFVSTTKEGLEETQQNISKFIAELASKRNIIDLHRSQPSFVNDSWQIKLTWSEDNYKLKTKFN